MLLRRAFRDRFNIPIPVSQLADLPFYKPADDTPEMKYLHERRKALGGYLPHRRTKADESFTVPALDVTLFRSTAFVAGTMSIAVAFFALTGGTFLLRIEGGLGLDEIGEITGAGRETVKSRLRYALARIRARFAT